MDNGDYTVSILQILVILCYLCFILFLLPSCMYLIMMAEMRTCLSEYLASNGKALLFYYHLYIFWNKFNINEGNMTKHLEQIQTLKLWCGTRSLRDMPRPLMLLIARMVVHQTCRCLLLLVHWWRIKNNFIIFCSLSLSRSLYFWHIQIQSRTFAGVSVNKYKIQMMGYSHQRNGEHTRYWEARIVANVCALFFFFFYLFFYLFSFIFSLFLHFFHFISFLVLLIK